MLFTPRHIAPSKAIHSEGRQGSSRRGHKRRARCHSAFTGVCTWPRDALRVGRLLDGGTATVVALRTLPGVGPMWDLSLDSVHTFAVGAAQAVVHNCPSGGDGGSQPTIYEKNASHIFRDTDGHFPDDTPQNRQQLINVAKDSQNFQGRDINGNDVYVRMNPDGTQTWAYVRNGDEIRNGGINQSNSIYQWNSVTQMFEPQ